MRLLVDEHRIDWAKAWVITGKLLLTPIIRCCSKRWRHGRFRFSAAYCRGILEIVYEINRRFLRKRPRVFRTTKANQAAFAYR